MPTQKTTLPFEQQYPGWFALGAFFPELFSAFRRAKPQLFDQIFGKDFDQGQLAPYRRFTRDYRPFDYLAGDPFGRPGGPSQEETDLLGGSLFGTTAPFDPTNLAGQAARNFSDFNQGLFPGIGGGGGGGGFGTAPSGPLPFDPTTASGMSYQPGVGWQPVGAGGNPSLVYSGADNGLYYQGRRLNTEEANRLLAQGPSAAGGGFGNMVNSIFGDLGGQMRMPTVPFAPGMPGGPAFPGAPSAPALPGAPAAPAIPGAPALPAAPSAPIIPGAPSLPPFSFDTSAYAQGVYNNLVGGQPGLADALTASLNPRIALPEQNIFQQVAAQSGGPLDAYVKRATEGTQKAFENELGKQQLALNSRFAGEGVFGSGANLSALSNLTSDATAQFGATIGQMQLQAAEQERGRIFTAASEQYGTEYARNLEQVKLQADQAQKMQATFASIAQTTGSAQASARASAYGHQATYLSNIYQTQVSALEQTYGTQANIYGTQVSAAEAAYRAQLEAAEQAYGTQGNIYGHQLNALEQAFGTQANIYGHQLGALEESYRTQGDIYGHQLGAYTSQQGQVLAAAEHAADLMSRNYGMSYDQAFQIALEQQKSRQAALNSLRQNYYQPGENLLEVLRPYFGLPAVSKTTGGGADIGALFAALASSAARSGGGGAPAP